MCELQKLIEKLKNLEEQVKDLTSVPTFSFALKEGLPEMFLPQKAEEKSSGYDVRAAQHSGEDLVIKPGEYFRIPLGFRALVPDGWWYQLHPRSSTFAKKQIHGLIGIIDESWEGETQFAGQYLQSSNESPKDLVIKFGDPIGQIIPVKTEHMIVKSVTNQELDLLFKQRAFQRGDGGFGSTDKK